MSRCWIVLAAAAFLATTARAEDFVETAKGKFEGKVTMTATEVSVETPALTEKVPANEIKSITFDGEPSQLTSARKFIVAGRYEEGLGLIEKLKVAEGDRDEVKQEVEYFRALCAAKLALAGSGSIGPAGKAMLAFVNAHPNSYHFFEASELVGDLYVAAGQFGPARNFYAQVAKAPWPDYKMRASVAAGQALLAEGKPAEAVKFFQSVLDLKAEGELAQAQRMAAGLGRARCQAETGDTATAIKTAEAVIAARAETEDADVLAKAYIIRGIAQHKAGKTRDAMYSFLHVDALYSANREAHAEALYHLVTIFREIRKPERAKEVETTLQEQYAESRWAKAGK